MLQRHMYLLCGHSPKEQDMHCAFPSCANSLFKSCVTKTSENRFPYQFNSLGICACRENRTLAGGNIALFFRVTAMRHEGPKTDNIATICNVIEIHYRKMSKFPKQFPVRYHTGGTNTLCKSCKRPLIGRT